MSEDRTLKGGWHPEIADFLNNLPGTDADTDFAKAAAAKVQDYLTLRGHVQAAQAAEYNWVNALDTSKKSLLGMVRADPLSTDLALSLAGDAVGALTAHHPDEATRTQAASELTADLRNQIAHTAVQTIAGVNKDAALAAIDKYGDHLGDDERIQLAQYAHTVQGLRDADKRAEWQEVARQAVAGNNAAAGQWLNHLRDSETGDITFPKNWGVSMMEDGRLAGESKAALHIAYTNLQDNGDIRSSNPKTLDRLIDAAAKAPNDPDHPLVTDVIKRVGKDLTMADASWLMERLGPQKPEVRNDLGSLNQLMQDARAEIGNDQAYERFTNWLMPTIRAGGSIDPDAPNYILKNDKFAEFLPTGDDLIAPVVAAVPPEERRPLASIFGGIFGGGGAPDELVGQEPWSQTARFGVPWGYPGGVDPTDPGIYGKGVSQDSGDPVIRSRELMNDKMRVEQPANQYIKQREQSRSTDEMTPMPEIEA